jgi:hypothetical protein
MSKYSHPHALGKKEEKKYDCGDKVECPLCRHVHDHAGCHECDCKVCPVSMHIHELHEGHEDFHGKKDK